MQLKQSNLSRSQQGVTLVELMIGLTLGLIVTGAAISLVASISQSNSETIRATRLTQELRSLSDIVTLEARRAHGDVPQKKLPLLIGLLSRSEGARATRSTNALVLTNTMVRAPSLRDSRPISSGIFSSSAG